jgi:hypothetical protein
MCFHICHFFFLNCRLTTEAMGIWRFAGAFAVVKRQSECGSKTAGMHVSQPMPIGVCYAFAIFQSISNILPVLNLTSLVLRSFTLSSIKASLNKLSYQRLCIIQYSVRNECFSFSQSEPYSLSQL